MQTDKLQIINLLIILQIKFGYFLAEVLFVKHKSPGPVQSYLVMCSGVPVVEWHSQWFVTASSSGLLSLEEQLSIFTLSIHGPLQV